MQAKLSSVYTPGELKKTALKSFRVESLNCEGQALEKKAALPRWEIGSSQRPKSDTKSTPDWLIECNKDSAFM